MRLLSVYKSNNNRTTIEQQWEEELRKSLAKVEMIWSTVRQELE